MLWRTLKIVNTITLLLRVSEQPETAEAGPVALVGRLKPEIDQIGRTAKIHARQAQIHFARLAVAAQKNAALVKQF